MEPPDEIQHQINQRIEAFVSEITNLARQHALSTLAAALGTGLPSSNGGRRRTGGKRSPIQIREEADKLLGFIQEHPGLRMEDIARDTGMTTKDLSLPIRKLLGASQVTTEGQKRATRYFPAGAFTRKRRSGGRRKKR